MRSVCAHILSLRLKLQTDLNGQFHTVFSSLGPALEETSLCVPRRYRSNLFHMWGFKPKKIRKELVYIVLGQYKIFKDCFEL